MSLRRFLICSLLYSALCMGSSRGQAVEQVSVGEKKESTVPDADQGLKSHLAIPAQNRVSRIPPPIYKSQMASLLTPLQVVQSLPRSANLPTEGAKVEFLLREHVIHVEEDGRATAALHDIMTALDATAAEEFQNRDVAYHAGLERPSLVMARTLHEDGRELIVTDDDAFIKRSEKPEGVHSDEEDVHLLFPDVKPGSILEHIVVLDDIVPYMQGQFMHSARMLMAGTLVMAGKEKEALPMALAVTEDPQVPQKLRVAAGFIVGQCLEKSDPRRASKYADQILASDLMPEAMIVPAASLYFRALARMPEVTDKEMRDVCTKLLKKHPGMAGALRTVIAATPIDLFEQDEVAASEHLLKAVVQEVKSGDYTEEDREGLAGLQKELTKSKIFAPLYLSLKEWLVRHPWPDADKVEKEEHLLDTYAKCKAAFDEQMPSAAVEMRYRLRLLTHYGPRSDCLEDLAAAMQTGGHWLRGDDDYKDASQPPASLEPLLDQMARLLVEGSWWEDPSGNGVARGYGEWVQLRQGDTAALAFYRSVVSDADQAPSEIATAHREMAWIFLRQKDYEAALEEWGILASQVAALDGKWDSQIEATYLALVMGKYHEAWQWLQAIAASKEDVGESNKMQKEAIQATAQNRARAEDWWKTSQKWWITWEGLMHQAGMDAPNLLETTKPDLGTKWALKALQKIAASEEATSPNVKQKAHTLDKYEAKGLSRIVLAARWHVSAIPDVAELLRGPFAKAFPQQADAARALAKLMEDEAAALQRKP